MARIETIKVECSDDKQKNIVQGLEKVIKTIIPEKLFKSPIIGQRKGDGDKVTLIYEGVINPVEVSFEAMRLGAFHVARN